MFFSNLRAVARRPRAFAARPFVRDVGGTFGATLVTIITSALQAILIARQLGPAGKGVIALVMLVPNLLSPMLSSGFAASCVYFASRAPAQAVMRNATSFALGASLVGVALVLVLSAAGAVDSIAPDLQGWNLLVATALLPLAIAQSVFGSFLVGLGRISKVNVLRTLSAMATLGFTAFVLSLGAERATETLVVGYFVLASCVSALHIVFLATEGAILRLGFDRPLIGRQLAYALRDHPGTVLQFLNYRLDQMFVSAYRGAGGVGLYTVAVTLAELLWVLPNSIAAVLFPKASRARGDEGRRTAALTAATSLVLALGGAVFLAVFGRWVIRVLFSPEFEEAFPALLWLLPGAALLAPVKVLAADLAGRGYPIVNSACAGLGLVVTVALDIALIPNHGIRGAAMASTFAYSSVAVLVVGAFLLTGDRRSFSRAASVMPE